MINKNLLKTIGNTPVIELNRYSPNKKTKIYAKLENVNPSGSIKDRIALFMVNQAIKSKRLKPDLELIEPTSGNTGISLAMVSAILGYRFTAVMPENVSLERRKFLQAYGAKIILTTEGQDISLANKIVEEQPKKYLMLNQFTNQNNVLANYLNTGIEIVNQVPEITHFIAGIGTSGTLIGVSKRLKKYRQKIQVIGLNPKYPTKIQGLRNLNFFQPLIFEKNFVDQIITIDEEESAFEYMKDLAKKLGLFVGISSGAALWGALKKSKEIRQGIIVTIFPDRGDRYLSLL